MKGPSGATVMKVRQKCCEGTLINSPLRKRQGIDSEIDCSLTYLHHRQLSLISYPTSNLCVEDTLKLLVGHSLLHPPTMCLKEHRKIVARGKTPEERSD